MNHLSSERLAADQEDAVLAPIAARTMLVWTAWIATLLLSKLPLVIARDLLGSDIPWIVPAWIATAALLFAATYIWQALKPLRGYFAIMGVILLVTAGLDPLLRSASLFQSFVDGQSQLVNIFADRILIVFETLIVLTAVILLGYSRRDAFLVVGDLKAPLGGQTGSSRRRGISWAVFGTIMALSLGGLFYLFLASQNPGMVSNLSAALPWLPLILLSAGLNAFGEEAMYRAAPLATLISPVGAAQALWMTSVWFGLGHYYGGIPSGAIGFVYSGLLGLLLGKAMLDTRGLGWSWIIHVVIDTVIYTAVAVSI